MTTVRANIQGPAIPDDLTNDQVFALVAARDATFQPTMLTDDHAASSYGIPVLCNLDGSNPRGPADLQSGEWLNIWYTSPLDDAERYGLERALVEAATRAGFECVVAHAV